MSLISAVISLNCLCLTLEYCSLHNLLYQGYSLEQFAWQDVCLEACPLNSSDKKSLDFALSRFLFKIFKTNNKDVVDECSW